MKLFSRRLSELYRVVTYLLLILVTSCVNDDNGPVTSLEPGDRCPDFDITLNTGERVITSSLKGKTTMIVFFTTTCPDCQRELPVIQKISDELADNPSIRVVCIARDESDETIAPFWESNGLTLPYSPQPDRTVYNLFASSIIPRVYIVDPSLTIIASWAEILPDAETIISGYLIPR